MSNATVRMGVDATEIQSGVTKVKAGLKAMSEAAKTESAAAMAALRQISNFKVQKSGAEAKGDAPLAAAIQREIELVKELETIRKTAATEHDRIILQTQARQRKNIADEIAMKDAAAAAHAAFKKQKQEQDELIKKGIAADAANQKQLAAKQEEQRLSRAQVQVAQQNLQATEKQGAASVRVSQMQTQMAQLRVQGNHKAADEVQREIALHHELAQIMQSNATSAQRAILRQQALLRNSIAMAGGGRGRSGGAQAANVGAQLQDAAVQAQMGAAWSTIIAQQGPQLVSALGGTGKMAGIAAGAGIAIAVSVGLAGLVVNSGKAFNEMVNQAKGAALEIGKISFTSSDQAGLARGVEIYKEQLEKMRDAERAGSGKGARFLAWIDEKTGGQSAEEKERDKAAAKKNLEFARQQINERSLEISKNTQEIAKLTAEGDEEGLERLHRKVRLEERIHELGLSGLGRDEIDKAVASETALSDAQQKQAEDKRRVGVMAKIADELDQGKKHTADQEEKWAEEAEARREKAASDLERYQAAMRKISDEMGDGQKRTADEKEKRDQDEAERIASASADMVSAQSALTQAAENRLSLTEKIALASGRVLDTEKEVAKQAKIGTQESQHAAAAALARARATQQELSLQRAAQFVGRSSADVRKMDRDEAKQKKELDKAGNRAIEADIRKADAENRRGTAKNPFGKGGLTEAQKQAMREHGQKAQGKDIQANAAEKAAASLSTIEKAIVKMADEIKSA